MVQINYKGLQVLEGAAGSAGQSLTDDYKTLADRSGPIHSDIIDPTSSNHDPQYSVWSKWVNTASSPRKIFICVSSSSTSAQWVQINQLSGDSSPTLSAALDAAGFSLASVGTISKTGSLPLTGNPLSISASSSLVFSNVCPVGGIGNVSGTAVRISGDSNVDLVAASGIRVGLGGIKLPVSDGSANQLLVTDGAGNLGWTNIPAIPSGHISAFAGSVLPSGWLWCDGKSYSTITYANLFNVIGYAYGGSGGNFNVPNLKGRVPVGYDSSDTTFDALARVSGSKTHTLTIAEMARHTHTINTGVLPGSYGGIANRGVGVLGATDNKGSGTAHNNMPPYIVLNYIIKI
jgi:microcystin-dependent protein